MSVLKYTWPKNNRDYYYAEASGTSMSAPMASGIIALMLQANPALDPYRIKNILAQSAITDTRTGNKPDSSMWGAGKINAYGALKQALLTVGLHNAADVDDAEVMLYPNPASHNVHIEYTLPQAKPVLIRLFDVTGREVMSSIQQGEAGLNRTTLPVLELKPGLYWVQINQTKAIKLLVN